MEEKKKYNFEGTVTISTEEYRDLISENAQLTARLEKKDHEYWFVNSSEEMELKLKLFEVDQREKEEKEEEEE